MWVCKGQLVYSYSWCCISTIFSRQNDPTQNLQETDPTLAGTVDPTHGETRATAMSAY